MVTIDYFQYCLRLHCNIKTIFKCNSMYKIDNIYKYIYVCVIIYRLLRLFPKQLLIV